MARLETVAMLKDSGHSLTVLREGDDFKDFTEEILEEMRVGAEGRMSRALGVIVRAVQWMLSAVYPATSASGEERSPAPSGAAPGLILGDLRDSWKKGRVSWSKGKTVLTGWYYSRHPSAGPLEWGSPKQRIPAHPYQRPALARSADELERILDGTE